VLDREFSYEGLFQAMEEEGVRYVVRLNLGGRPTISDQEGRRLTPSLRPGERRFYRGVLYKGRVRGKLAGEWRGGLREPLWLFTNLEPELALEVYRQRMKVEEGFRDLKGLLGLGKVMNKKRENMEKMVALLPLAYSAVLLTGERLREELYRGKREPFTQGSSSR
jgi:transposase